MDRFFYYLSVKIKATIGPVLTYFAYHYSIMKGTIMTINTIKDEYLRICRFERKLSPNTVRAYAFTLQDFSDFLKSVRLTKIEKVTKRNSRLHSASKQPFETNFSASEKSRLTRIFPNTLWRRNSSSIPLSIM